MHEHFKNQIYFLNIGDKGFLKKFDDDLLISHNIFKGKFQILKTVLLFVLFSGKVQRMLVYLGKFQARHAADTLLQAIKISHATDHNLG